MAKVSTDSGVHYTWGNACDGWHFVNQPSLSVIRERMPPGTAEVRHLHKTARQFFFVLAGVAVLELDGSTHELKCGEGLEVPPGSPHQIFSRGAEPLDLLVVSQPHSHGDREMASSVPTAVTRTTLVQPTSAELWAEARRLVEEYAASLDLDLSFQGFQHEIESLASEYGPPGGRFVLAEQAGTFIGCGGVRRFSESDCEMKRLYVVPANRRGGVGRTIAEALIEQARHLGYQAILLDTLPSMIRAQELYTLLGFEPTAAYRYNPAPGARFLRLELR